MRQILTASFITCSLIFFGLALIFINKVPDFFDGCMFGVSFGFMFLFYIRRRRNLS